MFPDDGEIKAPKDAAAPYSSGDRTVRWDPNQLALFKAELLADLRPAEDLGPLVCDFGPRFIEEHARAERQKPRGIEGKESILRLHIYPTLGARQLGSISLEDVAALKARLGHRSAKTVNNVLTVLAKMLRVAVEWKVLARMPVDVRLLKYEAAAPSFYEFEEYTRLVECAMALDFRKWLAVLLGGDAGLRLSEIIGLEWGDGIDLRRGEHGLVYVVRGISRGMVSTPKSGKARWVPMSPRLAAAVQGVFAEAGTPKPSGPVLLRDNGERVTDKVLHNWMAQVQRAAGLDDRGDIHVLRHTFCSHLAMRGVAPRTIQELAGHASIRTTERYMHLAPSEKGRAIAMLNTQAGTQALAPVLHTEWRRRESNPSPEQISAPSEVRPPQKRTRSKATRRPEPADALKSWRDALDEEAGGGEQ